LFLRALSSIYGAAAVRRRDRAGVDADVRRLERAVVSVGNLSVGGAGKTPTVAAIARLLATRGERPAILSRGYARRNPEDGVTVVSDGRSVLVDVDRAGDEPLMLAQALRDIPVLVSADRYLSGRLAETHLGATIHVLDDGFQHLRLARDVDLLLVSGNDLDDRVLPAGRLREPLTVASAADALLVDAPDRYVVADIARKLGVVEAFRLVREVGDPPPTPLFAVAGIARPDRFFDELVDRGARVTGRLAFGDHHAYTTRDLIAIGSAARQSGAQAIVTTEKDAVRLPRVIHSKPVVSIPLAIRFEPDAFGDWLMDRIGRAARMRAKAGAR